MYKKKNSTNVEYANRSILAKEIVATKLSSMNMLNTDIASRMGCSREYVRLVLKQAGLPTRQPKKHYLCMVCGAEISKYNRTCLCRSCFSKESKTALICDWCGCSYYVIKSVKKTVLKRNKYHFCSRQCLGKHSGYYYGFSKNQKR